MAKNTTTLYISDTSIRLMVTRGRKIHKAAELAMDASLADIGNEGKEAEVAAGIRQLFKDNKVGIDKNIIVGLSGLHCISRPFTLPELPKAMLNEAVTREAGRVLPVPLEQLYLSWRIISVSAGKIEGFMVAIQKQIADTVFCVLARAGFRPHLIDIKPLALARLAREANALIVDVQESEFDIIIMNSGIPQPVRTLAFPKGMQSLSERLSIVGNEIQRTVQFYNSNNPENTIQADSLMYVSGELAMAPELSESLARETGFQAAPLPSPLTCPEELEPALYMANIGLALKEITREAGPLVPNINILPAPYQPKQISLRGFIYVPVAAVAIAVLFLLVANMQKTAADIDSLYGQIDSTSTVLEQKQSQKKDLVERVAEMEQKLAGMNIESDDYSVAVNSINKQGDLMDGDVTAAVDNVVNGMTLSNIDRSPGQMGITGRVESEQEVLEYVRKLDATGRFAEITIDSLNKLILSDNVSEAMDFSLGIRLEDWE